MRYNKSVFLKGFREYFNYISDTHNLDINQINPENKEFCELMSSDHNTDFRKLSYKGQTIYYVIMDDECMFIFTDDRGNFVAKTLNDIINDYTNFYQNNIDEYNNRYNTK